MGEEVRTRGQKGDAEDRSFVCDFATISHGWIHSPLKNWEQDYFHSGFLNDRMGGNKCELLLYLEKIVGVYERPKAGIHPRWDSAPEKKSWNWFISSTGFLRDLQELCP